MKKKHSMALAALFPVFIAVAFIADSCATKRLDVVSGQFSKNYGCVALMPIENDTTFSPTEDLLSGYLNIELFQRGYEEFLNPRDFSKIFREEGKVTFPKRFNRANTELYSNLLGLDGAIYGKVSSPDKLSGDSVGKEKHLSVELYFLDVKSSKIIWSYAKSLYLKPGDYNSDYKKISVDIVKELQRTGFGYRSGQMPCWDTQVASTLKRLPDITREMFNTLSTEISDSNEEDLAMNMGNVFMIVGKRSLALEQYRKYIKNNPASPFRDEVERQVALIAKEKP